MKTNPKSILSLLCLLALTSFFTGCGEDDAVIAPETTKPEIAETVIDEDQMQIRGDDLVYAPNEEKPFTGVVVKHYENGNKEWEKRYKNGTMFDVTEWYKSGQKRKEQISKDAKSGQGTSWHRNGQKKEEVTFVDGLICGKRRIWHQNGEMRFEGSYKNGQRDGEWTWWDENGQVTKEAIYTDDELIEEKIYSPE